MSVDRSALWRAVGRTRSRWRLVALTVAAGSGAILASVGLLGTSGYLISRAAEHPGVLALAVAIVGVRFFGIARALLRYGERLASHELAFRSLADLRTGFFRAMVPQVPSALPTRRSELLSRFVADVDRLQDLYLRALGPPMIAAGAGLVAVCVAVAMNPIGGAVLAAGLLAAGAGVPVVARRAARRGAQRQGPLRARLTAGVQEIVLGGGELAIAGRGPDWAGRVDADSLALSHVQRLDALAAGVGTGAGTALTGLTVTGMAAVAIAAANEGVLPAVLIAALALMGLAAFEAVTPLTAAATSVDACADAASRVEAVTTGAAAVAEPSDSREPQTEGLRLDGVRFRYSADAPWVLDGVDLALEPGRSVAIIGASGAGKTSLADLCVKFREPTEGTVLLGGVDERDIEGCDVRRHVLLVAQNAYAFDRSIRSNLRLANPAASDMDLLSAVQKAGLGPWLTSLPDGLDTQVGEGGAKVSGGQRQRLAVARGLLSKAPLLVFDEPTAHLDGAAASEMLAVLARRSQGGCGVLVITHETEGLDLFDEVLELRDGRLGPPRQGSRSR